MHGFIVMLLACSAVMSLIALLYMAANPLLAKRYSEKGRYYVWLIILLGLAIPVRPAWGNALIRVDMPTEAAPLISHIATGQPGSELAHIPALLLSEAAPLPYVSAGVPWWRIGFALWLCGVVVFLSLHIVKHYSFVKRVKRWSKDVSDEKPLALLQSLKSEMGITRHIRLAECAGISVPMLLGFTKPQILLPSADLPHDELRFILKHELVHYKRGDLLYKCLVLIATTIHWFNPIVYMVARAINMQCELSCDAEIVQGADSDTRQQYSETIISVARYQSGFKTALSTTFYGGKKGMKNRISSIMTTNKKRKTLWGTVSGIALVAVLAVGTLMAFSACGEAEDSAIPADGNDLLELYVFNYDLDADGDVFQMRVRSLVEAGALVSDELPGFALWTYEELLEELADFVELEARHLEMRRDEVIARVSRARVLSRLEAIAASYHEDTTGFIEWVRENYTEQEIAIYVELGASQQLIDRLRAEVSARKAELAPPREQHPSFDDDSNRPPPRRNPDGTIG